MANLYYSADSFTKNTLARAENVAAMSTALVAAFDKVPPQLELEQNRVTYAADSGAADAYVVALPHTLASYIEGLSIKVKIANTNTGASTINVDGLGVKSIKRYDGSALEAGDLTAGDIVEMNYDGTNFIAASIALNGTAAHAAATATHGATGAIVGTTNTQTLTNKTLTTPTLSGGMTTVDFGGDADTILKIVGASATAFGSIGMSSAVFLLEASSSGSDNTQMAFSTSVAGTETEAMRITAGGALLIGHTSAEDAASVQHRLQVHGTSTNTSGIGFYSWQNSAGATRMVFAKSRSATIGSHTIVQDDDILGRIIFAGDDGDDLTSYGVHLIASVDGTPAANDMPGRLDIGTTPSGSSSPINRMRIDNAGNVGIYSGNNLNLDVQNALQIFGSATGGWTSGALQFTSQNDGQVASDDGSIIGNGQIDGNNFLDFVQKTGGVRIAPSETERARFTGTGNFLFNGIIEPASGVGTICLFNGTAPTGGVTNGIVLYAEDVSASSELKVRDEAGNTTTLSPHQFELMEPCEDMAWSYHSKRDGKTINVDMLKAVRTLEAISGEKLVHMSVQ